MTAQIKLKHSGGNGVIIEAPASNPASDKTITLPSDETGVFATKDSANNLQNVTGINGGQLGNRNLLINGDMTISQRNGGNSVAVTQGTVTLDRWKVVNDAGASSKFKVQQVDDAPVGLKKSLKMTSSSAYTVPATEVYGVGQKIEGFNMNQLMFGSSNAKTITISFWVKSSLTGTFSGSVLNQDMFRGYPYTYTINAANTWEYKTVTIAGSQNGTWGVGDGTGMQIFWNMGSGASRSDTAGQWSTSQYTFGANGATSVVGTNGATLQITGCQVEEGSIATTFEHRPYSVELALCQRYYEIAQGEWYGPVYGTDSTMRFSVPFKVKKRSDPTLTAISTDENCCSSVSVVGANFDSTLGARVQGNNVFLDGANRHFSAKFSANSEL